MHDSVLIRRFFAAGVSVFPTALVAVMLVLLPAMGAFPFPPVEDIAALQAGMSGLHVGERIAIWAERFVGTPYDPDPLGEYVTTRAVVADHRVDCMYHVFRSVELALSATPGEAVERALDMRFVTRGVLDEEGRVVNYDERYRYAIDMVSGGRWGRDVTASLAPTVEVEGSRGVEKVRVIPAGSLREAEAGLLSGDVVFFVKDPARRVVGEVVGHMGIIKREGDDVYLIHASGVKGKGGEVKKVLLSDYAATMHFVGVMVSRF